MASRSFIQVEMKLCYDDEIKHWFHFSQFSIIWHFFGP